MDLATLTLEVDDAFVIYRKKKIQLSGFGFHDRAGRDLVHQILQRRCGLAVLIETI
jgi:hypothetical protein